MQVLIIKLNMNIVFYRLHYEFPNFAINEIGTESKGNRREVGHGLLAEKALKNMIPDNFPYTIRLASQVRKSKFFW